MAYTTKLLRSDPDKVAGDLKAYLDGETITNLYSIAHIKIGQKIYTYIVFD